MFSPNFLLASGSQHVRWQCFLFRFASAVVLVHKSLCHTGNVLQQRRLIAFSDGTVLKRKGALISLDSDQLLPLALQTRFPPYFWPNPNSHSTCLRLKHYDFHPQPTLLSWYPSWSLRTPRMSLLTSWKTRLSSLDASWVWLREVQALMPGKEHHSQWDWRNCGEPWADSHS